jgi:RimJ/RimL family protein N-acetyltransferase
MSSVELLAFDPARDADLLAGWLRTLHVSRWWGDPEAQLKAVLERPAGGDDALIAVDSTPVGYVRWQRVPRSELEAAGMVEVPDGAIDIDIAIGDERFVGRGIGPAALAQAVARIQEAGPPPMIIACTSIANGSALRAFAKSGFRPVRQLEDPEYGRYWLLRHSPGSEGGFEGPASPTLDVHRQAPGRNGNEPARNSRRMSGRGTAP